MRRSLIAAILVAAPSALADQPVDRCLTAIQESTHVKSWSELHSFRQKYRSCSDDGVYAEIYSDLVTTILSNSWPSLAKLDALASEDPSYLDFVLKHIDITSPADRLDRIEKLAKGSCQPTLTALCDRIATAIAKIEP
jgi:hypothetical protein